MVHFYFDTSAIIKRYHKEKGTEVVERIFKSTTASRLVTSHWTVLEFIGVLSAKEKRRELSKEAFGAAVASFLKELTDHFTVRGVDDDLVAKALPMAAKYGSIGSADCLHLATAVELKQFFEEAKDQLVMVSADEDLCKAAQKEKLDTINPRDPEALKQVERILA